MQCRDGGWAAFDVDNTQTLCRELPFCDFGELIDPPSADVTAHVVEMLAAVGARGEALDRGVAWLLACPGARRLLVRALGGEPRLWHRGGSPGAGGRGPRPGPRGGTSAVRWLKAHQNEDGGWGEDLRSYADHSLVGRGTSTASQTAWALLALLAAGDGASPGSAVDRGVGFLVGTQRADGNWDEPFFTGTGFPGDFYINYHLYRLVFPLSALGRYLRAVGRG